MAIKTISNIFFMSNAFIDWGLAGVRPEWHFRLLRNDLGW
jgi:hypothetical protein